MKATFNDLKPESVEKLKPDLMYWCFIRQFDASLPIDHKFDINNTGYNQRYLAEYAVMYAILYDDKNLTQDLCDHHVDLEIHDEFCENKTPVELAISYGRAGILDILLRSGGKVPVNVQVPSTNPITHPLTFAWSLNELARQREVDYSKVKQILDSKKTAV